MGRGGLVEFKPARRVFAGRGRSLLTLGEWKIAFAAMFFGGAVSAGWFYQAPEGEEVLTLAQPPTEQGEAHAQAIVAAAPMPAAETIETAFETEAVYAQIMLAENDGRTDRAAASSHIIAQAARVVDGDTFYLDGLSTRIRLWGVDAPERSEQGFDEAAETLASLVAGHTLACDHVDTDPYQRIVARCYLESGVDISEAMIKSGAAEEFLRYTKGYYGGE